MQEFEGFATYDGRMSSVCLRLQMPMVGESSWETASVSLAYLGAEKDSQRENWPDWKEL